MVWNAGGVLAQWQLPEIIDALKRKRRLLEEEVRFHGDSNEVTTAAKKRR